MIGLERSGREHEIDVSGGVMVQVREHEPFRLDVGLAQVHEIGSFAMLCSNGHVGQHVVIAVSSRWVGL